MNLNIQFSRGRANSNKDGGSQDGKKRCLRSIIYRNQNYINYSQSTGGFRVTATDLNQGNWWSKNGTVQGKCWCGREALELSFGGTQNRKLEMARVIEFQVSPWKEQLKKWERITTLRKPKWGEVCKNSLYPSQEYSSAIFHEHETSKNRNSYFPLGDQNPTLSSPTSPQGSGLCTAQALEEIYTESVQDDPCLSRGSVTVVAVVGLLPFFCFDP